MEEITGWRDEVHASVTVPNGSSLMHWIEHLEYLCQLEPLPRLLSEVVSELAGIRKALEALAGK